MIYGLWDKRENEVENIQQASAWIQWANKKIKQIKEKLLLQKSNEIVQAPPVIKASGYDMNVPLISEPIERNRYSTDDITDLATIIE